MQNQRDKKMSELERDSEKRRREAKVALDEKKLVQPKRYDEYYLTDLAKKYPQGVTEDKYERKNVNDEVIKIIIRRVVVQGNKADDYRKVVAKWATHCFKNGRPITERMWITGTETAID